MIYFDNAATSYKKPECVIQAVTDAMCKGGNPGRGAYEISLESSRTVYNARRKLADFFSFEDPSSIVFTANATESLNMALLGSLPNNCHIITTLLEHNSVLRPLYMQEEKGTELSFVSCDEQGNIDYEKIEPLIKSNTKAIVTTHGSNVTGNLVDIERIGKITKAHGLIYIVDASQTAGEIPIDADKANIDILCATGHKGLMGPQGVGILGVKSNIYIKPIVVGGSGVSSFSKTQPDSMPQRLEAGTLNGHGIAGILAAVDFIERNHINTIFEKEHQLMQAFYEGVKTINGIKIYGDFSREIRLPIVSLNLGNISSQEISDILAGEYDIATRAGAHCAPLMHEFFKTREQGMVRFSFGYYNTLAEVEKAVAAIRQISEELVF